MKAVLSMSKFAKGGITEWLNCDLLEFVDWVRLAKELSEDNDSNK